MSRAHELRRHAQDCYERARVTVSPETKRALVQEGDDYLKEADELLRKGAVIQAAYPKPDLKIG